MSPRQLFKKAHDQDGITAVSRLLDRYINAGSVSEPADDNTLLEIESVRLRPRRRGVSLR
jgi:hypothetical protein